MRMDDEGSCSCSRSDSMPPPEEDMEVLEEGSEGFVSAADIDDDDDDGWVEELETIPVAEARATDTSIAAASEAMDIPSLLSALVAAAWLSTDDDGDDPF